ANAVVALDPKTLAVKDWYTQPGVELLAPPVIFQEDGKDIVAVTTKDGRILLLDADSLGGASHATPLLASASLTGGAATFAAQSPAMWQEHSGSPGAAGAPAASSGAQPLEGARWLLIPLAGVAGEPGSLGKRRRFERGITRSEAGTRGRQVLGPASLGFAEHRCAADAHRCKWCRVRG